MTHLAIAAPHKHETTLNYMHRCRSCKSAKRVTWTHSWSVTSGYFGKKYGHQWVTASAVIKTGFGVSETVPAIACSCGGSMVGKFIEHRESDTPCDDRCTGARGHVCECSCNGANHGQDHA